MCFEVYLNACCDAHPDSRTTTARHRNLEYLIEHLLRRKNQDDV
jgi:hypothetical protein